MNSKVIDYKQFYFIGIGGIGMSALARYFKALGKKVCGYDKTPSELTEALISEGCAIHFEDSIKKIPKSFLNNNETLVVYTPAVSEEHKELNFFKINGFTILKRSEALGLITRFSKSLCVAGTHGKTTTSAMLAHVLNESSLKCTAFLGGISSNFNSNVLINKNSEWTVIEADEFDRSFLHLSPYCSIITSMDPDHLDIYGDERQFNESFRQYAMKIDPNGWCISKEGVQLHTLGNFCTFNIESETADYSAQDISFDNGMMTFYVSSKKYASKKFFLGIPGIHNVLNALSCIVLLEKIGMSYQEIKHGLSTFKGVRRRFDIQIKTEQLVYIDDYAHHPEELRLFIDSIKMMYPEKEITGIFQPHLYSRTKDFGMEFSEQLSRFDELYLLPIYAAREKEIIGISSEWLLSKIDLKKKQVAEATEVLELLKKHTNGIVLTIGAGDIDKIVSPLKNILLENLDLEL